jgi:hypothetical protein
MVASVPNMSLSMVPVKPTRCSLAALLRAAPRSRRPRAASAAKCSGHSRSSVSAPVSDPSPPTHTSALMPRVAKCLAALPPAVDGAELGAPRRANHRAAARHDAGDVGSTASSFEVAAVTMPEKPSLIANTLGAAPQRDSRARAHRAVHAARVAATRENTDSQFGTHRRAQKVF